MSTLFISSLITIVTVMMSLLSPIGSSHVEGAEGWRVPQTADMYMKVKDDRFAWATGEQIRVIAYGWSGDTLRIPMNNDQVQPFIPREGGQPLLTIRKFQDDLSDEFAKAFEQTIRFQSLFFTVSWPGGNTYEYRLKNARIIAIRTMATGVINAQSYEEIGFTFDTIERTTPDSDSQ